MRPSSGSPWSRPSSDLVFEAIYRKTYAALAAAGVATFATALAATVPLLDPTIKSLQPVLRSNLWLTIHVLTIVSSYGAFALAMGLGHDRHMLLSDRHLSTFGLARWL